MPRGRGQTSLAKNQLQLAIALSSSLEESKARELSKLAEDLPADAIEDGAVPQRIKQMQKEFLERLQPKPVAAPARRTRKVVNPAVLPTLLIRSCDERLRIITEKVALVLIKDDVDFGRPAQHAEKAAVHTECDKENLLWQKSSVYVSDLDRDSYYVDSLSAYISPAESKTSCRLKKKSNRLPERLISPVKFKPQIPDHSTKDDMDGQDVIICPQRRLNIQQFAQTSQNYDESIIQDDEAGIHLQDDWKIMVNNAVMSDVTIITKEGAIIYAHTLVFRVRCPDILNDVQDERLSWTRVNHSEAIAFLNYVYSGRLDTARDLPQHSDGLTVLARRYRMTQLLKAIQRYDSFPPENSSFGYETNVSNLIQPEVGELNGNISSDLFSDGDELQDILDPLTVQNTSQITENPEDTGDGPFVGDVSSSHPDHPQFSTPVKSYPSTTPTAGSALSYSSPTPNSSDYIAYNKRKLNSITLAPSKCVSHLLFVNSEEETEQSLQIPIQASQGNPRRRSYVGTQKDVPVVDLESDRVVDLAYPHDSKRMLSDSDDADMADCGSAKKVRYEPPCKADPDTGYEPIEISSRESSPSRSLSPPPVCPETESASDLRSCGQQRKGKRIVKNMTNFERLLDDSFECNVNDSVLLRGAEQHTPQQRATVINHTPLRTPLEDVKTSSPVTPMPEFYSLSQAQFEAELVRNGLKRNLSRVHGAKLLEHIYIKTHPLAEEVNLRGKRLFIPVDEKSPARVASAARHAPSSATPHVPCQVPEDTVKDLENSDIDLVSSYDSPEKLDYNWEESPGMSGRDPGDKREGSNGGSVSSGDEAEVNWDEFPGSSGGDLKSLDEDPKSSGEDPKSSDENPKSSDEDPISSDGDTESLDGDRENWDESPYSPDYKPNNRQSSSSHKDCAVREETLFLDDEESTPEAFSDLKAGIHKWLASADGTYSAVVRYEPLWLESIQLELKEFLKVNVKMNQLMDVLDDEGIVFRVGQKVSRSRSKKSPKKKATQSKKRQPPKKLEEVPG